MAARYIKVNPKVVQFLGLETERNKVSDGNYLLWQNDLLKFGRPLTEINATLDQIGGIALMSNEARQEQDGTASRPLPMASDERFRIEVEDAAEPQQDFEESPTDEEPQQEASDESKEESSTDKDVEP